MAKRADQWMRAGAAALALAAAPLRAETLADALADAYRSNPQLKAQRAELRILDERYVQAGAPYRLQATLNGQAAWSRFPVNNPVSGIATSSNDFATVGVSASQILLNGGRTAAALSEADANMLSSRAALVEAENQVMLDVVDTYMAVLRDAEIVAIRQRSVDAFGKAAQSAGARRRGGDLTRTDTAQAEAQLGIARVALASAAAQLQNSRGRFATIVGRTPGTLDLPAPLAGLPTSVEDGYRIADADSPSLLRAVHDARAGRARVQAARADANPTVSLNGTVGFTGPASFSTSEYRRDLVGRVIFSMPLLAGGQIDSRRREAIADKDRLEALIEQTRRQVDLQVLQAWNQSVSADQQLAAGESAVRAAEISSTGSAREFIEGYRSTFEVLNEQQRLLDAQVVTAQARYASYLGRATLLASLGRLEAARIVPATPRYDGVTPAAKRRDRIFGPFDPVLVPLDRLQRPSSDTKPVPTLPAAAAPALAPAATAIPSAAPLATALPAGQPVCANDRPC